MLKVIISILWAYLICLLLTICVTETQAQGAGSALDLDGNNDYVNCGDNASLYPTGSVTVEAWFKHTSEDGYIFSNWWGAGFRGINLGVYPLRDLQFTIGDNTTQDSADAGSKYNDGKWHHVVGVYDKTNLRLKIFIDGVLKQNKSTSITSINYSSNHSDYVTLGAVENGQIFGWGSYHLNGSIDEVRIWNVALDEATIRDWMHKKVTNSHPNWSNLVGYWRFDDGADPTDDYSDNNNTGDLVNGAIFVTSTAPVAGSSVEDKNDVRAIWSSNNSNASSIMTITDSDISGDNCIILGHNNAGLTVNLSDVPSGINRRLNRVWQLEEYGTLTGNILFDCIDLGIGNGNELRLLEDADGTFSNATIVIGSYSSPNFTVSGRNFAHTYYYTLASTSADNSLPVELRSFTAANSGDKVILRWRTETEVNNIGFTIYRSESKDSNYTKIAFVSGAGNSAMPTDYQFKDTKVEPGKTYYYCLEDIDITGERNKSDRLKVVVPKLKLASLGIIKKCALLQNFPNPFNPETWIPFQLAQNAPISINIYDTEGQLIRTIALGNQNAGVYTTKAKAAYWNGRDSFGEKVASGIYWYTLQAGEYRATRKMVIVR